MYQIAVYGKGGIGKSTMSANISMALSERGLKVMQVGCDPKHDSTRLLLGGRTQTTVLDYIRSTPVSKRRLSDVAVKGSGNVTCIEAGGPEPGVGCAGRGILTTFDTMKRLGADSIETDVRIYDVLGDVVCGGFAVPLRPEYADAVILVTSGEFMSMYAANNIMRGMLNFGKDSPRLLGLVLNSRGMDGEEEAVRRFADAAGTRILAVIPRDRLFSDAESKGCTVIEAYPDSEAAAGIRAIADAISAASEDGSALSVPRPLDDGQLDDLAAGRPIRSSGSGISARTQCPGCGIRTSARDARPIGSCAAFGAVSAFMKVDDTEVIVHGPMSCAYLMDTSRAKAVLELYGQGVYAHNPSHNIRCTVMDRTSAVFGGERMLSDAIESAVSDGRRSIAVVTTCMPGLIGDDYVRVVEEASARHPGVRISLASTDGDIAGDYTDGFMMAAEAVSERMDPDVAPDGRSVNLVGSSFLDIHTPRHLASMERMLDVFGLKVNCRFLDETTAGSIEGFCRASADIMMSDTPQSRELMSIVTRRTGRTAFPMPMPIGLREYQDWMQCMGERLDMATEAEAAISRSQEDYDRFVSEHSGRFEGKRMIVASRLSSNVDWLIGLLDDLGADILRIGFSPRYRGTDPISAYPDRITAEYTDSDLERDLEELRPDLLICDITRMAPSGIRTARMSKSGVGYMPVMEYAVYLENMMRLPIADGWKRGRSV